MYVAMCCKSKSGVECNTVIILGMKTGKRICKFIFCSSPCLVLTWGFPEWMDSSEGFWNSFWSSGLFSRRAAQCLSADCTSRDLCLKVMLRRSVILWLIRENVICEENPAFCSPSLSHSDQGAAELEVITSLSSMIPPETSGKKKPIYLYMCNCLWH